MESLIEEYAVRLTEWVEDGRTSKVAFSVLLEKFLDESRAI